jgi:hypothetical protein
MRTFAWSSDSQPETGDIRLDDSLLDQRIRAAVEQTLVSGGYSKTDRDSADFFIAYQVGIQQRIKADNVQTGFTAGRGSSGRYGSVSIRTGTDVKSYDEGTLFIDVLDPGNGRLLWRGKGTNTVSTHADQDRRNRNIKEAVEKILGQFPPR